MSIVRVCVPVCVNVCKERERERESSLKITMATMIFDATKNTSGEKDVNRRLHLDLANGFFCWASKMSFFFYS